MPGSGSGENLRAKTRFGVFEFDPQARELSKHGVRLKVQEQPIQILAALLEQPGQIVPREELQRRLWPDGTFVDYDQSLNKAVNKLRESLGDSANNPLYIETLARRGYRFVAPVEVDLPEEARPQIDELKAEEPKQGNNNFEKPLRSQSRLRRLAWPIGLSAIAVLASGLWPVAVPKVVVTQLTAGTHRYIGVLGVHNGRILFTAPFTMDQPAKYEFWSISTEGGESRLERMPFLNRPLGSAHGQQVDSKMGVFLIRAGLDDAGRGVEELWLVGFDGSKPRRIGVAVGSDTYSVSPDLRTLLRAGKEGLFVRPVEGGPERLIARIDWERPSQTFWHPSGKLIAFSIFKERQCSVWQVKADGTGMRPVLGEFEADEDAVWSPNGETLYFTLRGEICMRTSRRWLGWMRSPQVQRLTVGSTLYNIPVGDPTNSRLLYASGWVDHAESMKLNRQTGVFEPYLGGLSANWLDYSPDGQWIAYVSYPELDLWKCRRDGSDKILLDDSMNIHWPRWSPDGKRLAFAATRKEEFWAGVTHFHLYTISANGGKSEPVKGVSGGGFDPNWSPDGKRLVFAPWDFGVSTPKAEQHVSIVNLQTGTVDMVPGSEGILFPRWSPDGRRLEASSSRGSVLYDFETRRWVDVEGKGVAFAAWSKDSQYVFGSWMDENKLVRLDVAKRKVEETRHQGISSGFDRGLGCLLHSGGRSRGISG